jgi:hypothetical protein
LNGGLNKGRRFGFNIAPNPYFYPLIRFRFKQREQNIRAVAQKRGFQCQVLREMLMYVALS